MTQKRVNLPTIQNVNPGSTATLSVPIGPTYYELGFDISGAGATLAHLKNIELKVNGKTMQKFKDGMRLRDRNMYYRRGNYSSAQAILYMHRPEFTERLEREIFRLGTGDVQTVDVSFDIDDAAPDAISVKAWALKEDLREPMGIVAKVVNFTHSFATDGTQDIADIPRTGDNIPAIFMYSPTVTAFDVQVDQVDVVKMTTEQAQRMSTDRGRFVDLALPDERKFTAIDFVPLGDPNDALETRGVSDLRLHVDSSAGTIELLVEYIGGFQGI